LPDDLGHSLDCTLAEDMTRLGISVEGDKLLIIGAPGTFSTAGRKLLGDRLKVAKDGTFIITPDQTKGERLEKVDSGPLLVRPRIIAVFGAYKLKVVIVPNRHDTVRVSHAVFTKDSFSEYEAGNPPKPDPLATMLGHHGRRHPLPSQDEPAQHGEVERRCRTTRRTS